jgi:hypothetical protein
MSFIKKNYEKILLGAVLLGLVVSLLLLPVLISRDQQALSDIATSIIHGKVKPLEALDMSRETNIMERVQSPYPLDFETTNRLFNPMQWQKTADGRWVEIKIGNEVGPNALVVENIRPLYFRLKLDSIEPANQISPKARYVISIQRENAPMPGQRNPRQRFISVQEKNDIFTLVSDSGPTNNPDLVLQLVDTGETVDLGLNKPFQKVDGYAADLKYAPENRRWNDQRVGADLKFNKSDYIVVVIDTNEVVISSQSNQKKITRPYQP